MGRLPARITLPPAAGLPPHVREALLARLAVLAIGIIRRRTKAGQDVDGRPFVAYSKGYKRAREASGYRGTPDLWLSGHMLGSMQVLDLDSRRALIGFTGSAPATRFKRRMRKVRNHRSLGLVTDAYVPAPRKGRGGKTITHTASPSASRSVPNALKALWAETGGAHPGKARRFFGLSRNERALLVREAVRFLKSR